MKITLSVIKADIGSIGGHIQPSRRLLDAVRVYVADHCKDLLINHCISFTGDDVAILATHKRGCNDERVHELAWNAFLAGTAVARQQGLYGAGQDLLKDAFSGNVRGMGPAVAELEFDERPNEPFLFSLRTRPIPVRITCRSISLSPTR
jgi:fructose 1,6-bisphosphate aldolase/phosphatase